MSIIQFRIGFITMVILIAAAIYFSCSFLPEHVAANFGSGGEVVTFNERETYRFLMTFIAVLIPLFVYVSAVWIPRCLTRYIFLPHREYWLSPERRSSTDSWIEKFGLVNGVLVAVFWCALHGVNYRASLQDPPHYELWPRLMLLIAWLAFIVVVSGVYHWKFNRIEEK